MVSIMGLHLQYRLWIAELNADINALRIFNDYFADKTLKKNGDNLTGQIKSYKEQFLNLRKSIDDLRHDMHLYKMELAAMSKKPNPSLKNIGNNIRHKELRYRYELFRKAFDKTKKDFQKFGSRLMK